jgi:hypothetical protein
MVLHVFILQQNAYLWLTEARYSRVLKGIYKQRYAGAVGLCSQHITLCALFYDLGTWDWYFIAGDLTGISKETVAFYLGYLL